MPDQTLFLGLELTSSHLIILLIDQKGQVIEELQRSHGAQGPEQAPQDWWRAVRTGIKETLRRAGIDNKEIRAIGITAASDAPILLDFEGAVLCKTHVGLHEDMGDLHELLTKNVGARNLQNITNQPARANTIAAKLLYMRENNKRAWHDAAHVLMPSSFLRYRLTGKHSIDAGSAGETQLFNTKQRAWSKVLLQRIGVPPAWMPQIGPGKQICGRVEETAAKESGLATGTPVIQAGHRSSCIAVAMGANETGDAVVEMNNYGTLAINSNIFQKLDQQNFYATCNGMSDNWLYCADACASTKNTDWLLNEIATNERNQARRSKQDPIAKLSEIAAEIEPGSDGLVFVSPSDEHGGGFAGLQLDHKHGHMIRA
ncbi:MAG: hypothetical protein HRU15_20300, partial [Planctomycetes bacterium]|nr:hypothetical protein [Planctomycetota bacterium]